MLDTGWGRAARQGDGVLLECLSGGFTLRTVDLVDHDGAPAGGRSFAEPVTVPAGSSLVVPLIR